jgi:hypothetical protein
LDGKEGITGIVWKILKKGLENKNAKYNLAPVATGFFGDVLDFNKMSFLTRKAMKAGYKSQLQKHGFKEVKNGVYNIRN